MNTDSAIVRMCLRAVKEFSCLSFNTGDEMILGTTMMSSAVGYG